MGARGCCKRPVPPEKAWGAQQGPTSAPDNAAPDPAARHLPVVLIILLLFNKLTTISSAVAPAI